LLNSDLINLDISCFTEQWLMEDKKESFKYWSF
jgi:hypothetical protein